MSTGDEHTALKTHSQIYQDWVQSWTTLREVVAAADPEPRNLNPDLQNAMASEFRLSRDVVRTAIGKRNGSLAGVHPVDLGAAVWRGLFEREFLRTCHDTSEIRIEAAQTI